VLQLFSLGFHATDPMGAKFRYGNAANDRLSRSWPFWLQINDQTTNTHSECKQRIFQCNDRSRWENTQAS
jgi:hypothetical protein